MDELGKKLSLLLEELLSKRSEVEELQNKHNVEQLSIREMKEEIENLKTERKNIKTQLDFTNKALHTCEDNFSASRDSAVKHKLNLDAATKTIEAMKEQAVTLHTENTKLKRQVEELEKNKQVELSFRESCSTKHGQSDSIVDTLVRQMRDLEKDLKNLDMQVIDTVSLGNKITLLLEQKDGTIRLMKTKNDELSAKLLSLASENKILQDSAEKQRTVEHHQNCTPNSKILQEWETAQSEMKRRMASWETESEILNQTLQNALEAQRRFQKLEQAASDRSKMLETKLQELQRAQQKSHTDCSVQTDLNILIDVASGTEGVAVSNVETQTDRPETSTALESKDDTGLPFAKPIQDTAAERQEGPSYNSPSDINNQLTDESLSAMISRLNQEMNCQSQDLSELPTQINNFNNAK